MNEKIDMLSIEHSTLNIDFRANQIVEGFLSGLHKSPFHGFSVEFADYRAYNTGEDTRFIDWKLFARTDKLFVKNYQQETNLRALAVLDTSASMCFPFDKKRISFASPDKLLFSVYASASIIHMLYRQRDAFGLSFVTDKTEYLSDIKSSYVHKKHVFTQLEILANKDYKEFTKNTDISPSLHRLSETLHKRSMVIIFTDLLSDGANTDDFVKSLEHLKHNKHEVILFHVRDTALEEEFLYKDRPYKFVDAETNEIVKLNPADIREEYHALTKQKFDKIHSLCDNLRIDYVDCDINKGFNQVLLPYFYKRLRMH